eukprot:TRINITY_DN34963_c0_g1_i1.p1 TRINITY_DN34963_c0_g1~~TRINITY_DN34963_c0_g1_i1.p1  ORF type:complete len:316 (-),score=83.26 TRINITY_DN34963_c0_g1_i1:167-1081(-)
MALIRFALVVAVFSLLSHGSPGRKAGNEGRKSKKVLDGSGPQTCPGFPGYCSESYPGQTCLVVCAFGRNNVPVCQDDGTWTAEPRCIEHEPGKEEQVPGTCPGVPGYCSLDLPGGLCTFECISGPHVRSSCKPDGTWDPYPTCEGDVRETKDGCDPCPGPFGGPRNRTAEAGGSRGGVGGAKVPGRKSNNKAGGRKQAGGGSRRGGAAKKTNGGGRNRGQSRKGGNQKRNGGGRKSNGGGQKTNGGGKRKSGSAQNRAKSGGSKGKNGGAGGCPDQVLQACIDVCPGSNAKIFGACVAGCSKRC